MARLIDADDVVQLLYFYCDEACSAIVEDIENIPTVDNVPVVHGTKITRVNDVFSEKIITVCSECSGRVGKRDVYCRHCGAKMDMDDPEDWEG